jgi:hypothetical protein
VIENDVQNDAKLARVRSAHEIDEIFARAESRIHLEKILDRVPVIAVVRPSLFPDRPEPYRRDAEIREVRELRGDAFERAALPAAAARFRPVVPAESRRPRCGTVRGIDHGPRVFVAIAEAVGQQKVDHLVAPIARRRKQTGAPRKPYRPDR